MAPSTSDREVLVVRTGTANTASVLAAFERLGARPRVTSDRAALADAERVVLPGVGAFAAAAGALEARGLTALLAERVRAGRATLAICLGMQLLFEGSDESPGVAGLGVAPGRITRFPAAADLRVPQLGWNAVRPLERPDGRPSLLEPGQAYFANTFRAAVRPPAGWGGALSDHGGPFTSALERGGVLACQFHPELSGAWGMALLERWLEAAPTLAERSARTTEEVS